MNGQLQYAVWTVVRQDLVRNRVAYRWTENAPSEESLQRLEWLVRENWQRLPDGVGFDELLNEAMEELMRNRPSLFNPITGKYER